MNVAVIGLGSMGKRRIRLMRKYDGEIQIVGIDCSANRREECEEKFGISTFENLGEAIEVIPFDCAFVCAPPLSHSEIITQCLKQGLHVFSELNLVPDGYDENISLAKEKALILFLSSTFLYREEIKEIKSITRKANCLLNYTYHVGQYLPDWHPWENYRDFFVSQKRSNACREIFAIELPWLCDVFGEILEVKVLKGKMSSLDVDYDDNFLVVIQHAAGHKGTLAVDIVSRKAVRNLEIFGEHLYLSWDGSPDGLYVYDFEAKKDINIQLYKNEKIDQLKDYSRLIIENAYLNEIVSFFEAIKSGKVPTYSFNKDKDILEIIDRIEGTNEKSL